MFVLWLLFVVCVLLWTLSRRPRSKLEPPVYPGALPLLGHLHLFAVRTDLLAICKKLSYYCLKTGEATLILLGPRSDYFVVDPEDALTVANACLKKNFMYFYAKPWLGEGLITGRESIWRQHRKLLNPSFRLQVMHSYMEVFNRQGRRLVEKMAKRVDQGPFDHQHDIHQIALESICMTALGLDLTDDTVVNSEYTDAVNEILGITLTRFMTPWMYVESIFQHSDLKDRQDKCLEILHNASEKIIKSWRVENEQKSLDGENDNNQITYLGKRYKPFLELLLELSEERGLLTDDEVSKHVDTIIVTGYETVACALIFTMVHVGSNPCVQERLQAELKRVFKDTDRDVENKDLSQLVYLEAVIKETLRLCPVVPAVARYVDKDVKLKKTTLLAGHTCYISLFGIHRHSMWGKDAEEFRPERWLDPLTLPDTAKAFVAFSLGRRNCIGRIYAMMFLKTTLAHFFRRYEVTADHTKMVLRMDFLLKPVRGHEISLVQRKNIEA